jgi:hypothetical protein
MQLFHANQSIRNVRDISNATHDRPIPSIGTIFNIISKSLVFGIVGCIATHNALMCFLKLNIGNKYGLCSELKKCPGMYRGALQSYNRQPLKYYHPLIP